MLTVLRWTSNKYYLDALQVIEVMKLLPLGHEARMEIFVVLWARLVDEENLNIILDAVEPDGKSDGKDERRMLLFKRIGYLSLFNPLRPDGWYKLNFAVREEHLVATILIQLSAKEPGENVIDERFNDARYEVPATWLTALPVEGIWELIYQTVKFEPYSALAMKSGRKDSALPQLRISLARKVRSPLSSL